MTSLRFLPLDIAKEIMSYLDFDACALLNWTFDRRIRHFFEAITFPHLRIDADDRKVFYPAHYHLMATMKGVDELSLQSQGALLDNAMNVEKLAQLAPKHLNLELTHAQDIVCAPLLASLQSIHICLVNSLASALNFVQRLSSLPRTLQRLGFSYRLSSHLSVPILNAIAQSLPDSLVSLELDFAEGTLDLGSILSRVPNVENLVLKGIHCGYGEVGLRLPASLHSFTLWTFTVFTKSDFSNSNLRRLCIERLRYGYDPHIQQAIDLEKLLPTSLVHLELPAKLYVVALPKSLESLKVSCTSKEELVHCMENFVKPLKTLRTLSLLVDFHPSLLEDFSMQLPTSLTCLRLDTDCYWDCEAIFHFGGECLTSLPLLRLDIIMEYVNFVDLFEMMRTYTHARFEVRHTHSLEPDDVSLLKPLIPDLSLILQDYDVSRLCRGISDALTGTGDIKLQLSVCMCKNCLFQWFRDDAQQQLRSTSKDRSPTSQQQALLEPGKSVTFPLPAQKNGHEDALLLECANGIKFVHALVRDDCRSGSENSSTARLSLPTERLSLAVRASEPTTALQNIPIGRFYYNRHMTSFRSILQMVTSTLTHLDFGTLPIDDPPMFWAFIPPTVRHLRSKFDFQPGLQFGARALGHKWSCDYTLPEYPFDFVLLDTPYFVYSPHQLASICFKDTLETLSATIHAQDSTIFEFALNPTSCSALSFPNLKNLKLRASPIITGTLLVNFPAHVSFRVLEQEVVEAFRNLDVLVVGCKFQKSLSFHPRVTHAIMTDRPNTDPFSSVECVNSKSSPLVEMKISVSTQRQEPLVLPYNLTSLDLTLSCQPESLEIPPIPAIPPQLKRLRIDLRQQKPEKDTEHAVKKAEPPVVVSETLLLQDLPVTLESIIFVRILPLIWNRQTENEQKSKSRKPKQTTFSPLPHLHVFEIDLTDDYYLDSLCNLLPKTTVVKVESARLTCRLLPLDLEEFTWKAALSSCLDFEKRFTCLKIGSWRAGGSEMKVISTCLKRAFFNFDFDFDSLFDNTTRARKPSLVTLVTDLVELHKDAKFPVTLPVSTERLEYRVTRSFFSDPSLKALSKTAAILKPSKLQAESVRYDLPNVTHVAFHLAAVTATTIIDYATLPVNTRIIEFTISQTLKAEKVLKIANETEKLKEVITSSSIVVKPAHVYNNPTKVHPITFKVSQLAS